MEPMQRRSGVTSMLALVAALSIGLGGCGGSDGEPAATGGAATSGGSASGGAGGGGSSSAGAANVTATCDAGQAKFAHDGGSEQTYDLGAWPSLYGSDMGQARRLSGRLGSGHYEVVFEPEVDASNPPFPNVILDTKPWPIRRALLADASEQTLGPVRCVTEGSGSTLARQGDQLLLDLKNVDVIAACADTPVEGQINLCFEFSGCDGFDGGSVGGTPWVLQPDTWAGGLGNWFVEFADGSYMRARTTNTTTGPAYWALIVTHPTGPYGGQVYCASSGSVEETEGSFGYTVQRWTGLGTMTCGAGTSTSRGCMKGGE